MRWDGDTWSERFECIDDLGDRLELALAVVLVVAAASAGFALILGLDFQPAVIVGLVVAVIGVAGLAVASKRRGTSLFGDD